MAIFHLEKERKTSKIVGENLSREGHLFRGFCLCVKGSKKGLSAEGREESVGELLVCCLKGRKGFELGGLEGPFGVRVVFILVFFSP